MTTQTPYKLFIQDVDQLARNIQKVFSSIYWLVSLPFIIAYWFLKSLVFCASSVLLGISTLYNTIFSSKKGSDSAKKDSTKISFGEMAKTLNAFIRDVHELAGKIKSFTLPAFWLISFPLMATFKISSLISSVIWKCTATVWQFFRQTFGKTQNKPASTQNTKRPEHRFSSENGGVHPKNVPSSEIRKKGKQSVEEVMARAVQLNKAFVQSKGEVYVTYLKNAFHNLIDSIPEGSDDRTAGNFIEENHLIDSRNPNQVVILNLGTTSGPCGVSVSKNDYWDALRLLMLEVKNTVDKYKESTKFELPKERKELYIHVFKKLAKSVKSQENTGRKISLSFSSSSFKIYVKKLLAVQYFCQSAINGRPFPPLKLDNTQKSLSPLSECHEGSETSSEGSHPRVSDGT